MKNKLIQGHQGFSLLEIMVALVLVSTLFLAIPMGIVQSEHQVLEEVIDEFDRAIRFAQNESILRNSVVRLNVQMDKEPMEYSVQYGPSANLVLPTIEDTSKLSLKEREGQLNKIDQLNSQFNNVTEFSDENNTIDEDVKVTGLASSYLKSIQTEGSVSIYFYPTGEKDESIIYFSTETEMATLEVPAFENQTYVEFYQYSEGELATLSDSQQDKMKELYDKWIKY